MNDPFGTAALRERVLAAWAASPARFREDANAEEDAATGAPLVELAQNAADAASRAGGPGRLLVEVAGGVLYAANTGAPLGADGVEALSHLRASTKAAGSVGRFGVGFKAVLSLTDEPAVFTRAGGVRWSRVATAGAVAGLPSLAAEVARRGGAVPVMRLPYAAEPDARATTLLREWDTVVALPLTAEPDLSELDAWLLLVLPLESMTVAGRVVVRDPAAVAHTASGALPPDLLADRPVEERERAAWSVTVAVPAPPDRLLRAPQPTGERVDLPVFVSASVPLEPSRRHVVPGPLADWLAARAAEAYVALLESLPPAPDLLDLLPATLPAGAFDLALREALAPLLPGARVLPGRRRGEETAVVDLGPASEAVTAALDLPQLLDPAWLRRRAALATLGVRVLETADVVDLLAGLGPREPAEWARLYEALAAVPDRDALRALPVPLADGRVVTGPRGVLLTADPELAAAAAGLALRVAHPDVATGRAAEVLRGAGAADADAGAVLDSLRAEVEASLDDEPLADPEALAAVVLRLLRAEPSAAEGRDWLGALALPSEGGDLRAADELLLPGAPVVRWVRDDSPFGVASADLLGTYGAAALTAAGVVGTLALRDFDEVRDDAWAEALGSLTELDGETLDWLRAHVVLPAASGALLPPRELLAADADPVLDGLYERLGALPEASRGVAARLGLVTAVGEMDDDALDDLAGRLAARPATLAQVRVLYAALARAGVPVDPTHVRAVRDGELVVVPAGEAYAVDRPDLLPLLGGRAWLPVDVTLGRRLAGVLGVRLASEVAARVTSTAHGTARLADLVPGAPDVGVDLHDPLLVDGVPVAWWAGRPLAADGSPRGLARLAAWLSGAWPGRYATEAALRGERDDEALLDPLG